MDCVRKACYVLKHIGTPPLPLSVQVCLQTRLSWDQAGGVVQQSARGACGHKMGQCCLFCHGAACTPLCEGEYLPFGDMMGIAVSAEMPGRCL